LNYLIDLTVPASGKKAHDGDRGAACGRSGRRRYRDMLTIIHDRAELIEMGLTLEQQAAQPTRDYDGRYGASTGLDDAQFVSGVWV
jgi:hypothetical protein